MMIQVILKEISGVYKLSNWFANNDQIVNVLVSMDQGTNLRIVLNNQ